MTATEFIQYKKYLFSIAYNITSDVHASEDLVQDTYEKWLSLDRSLIKNIGAYLSKIIVNKSIDYITIKKKERELYKGIWLPEPVLRDEYLKEEETADYAFLFLLENLNPHERAVFVLRELFNFSYQEIADFMEISQDNSRQILHRAKAKVKSSRPINKEISEEQKPLFEAFVTALEKREFDHLQQILKSDIILYSDGGGKASAAINPIYGASNVIRFFNGILKSERGEFTFRKILVNKKPGLLVLSHNEFHSIIYPDIINNHIADLYLVRNPEKINLKVF